MRRLFHIVVALVLTGAVCAQPGDDPHGITLERIMSDPEWIGLFPERSYWSDSGDEVLFFRDRPGQSTQDLVSVDIATGDERLLDDAERSSRARTTWVYNEDRSVRACVRGGDLYFSDPATGELSQITRTAVRESSVMFLSGGEELAYETGGNWFVMNLRSPAVRQVADVRFEDEPTDEEEKDGEDYLDSQQERLFATIAERQDRQEQQRSLTDAVRDASRSAVPGPFYLGKKNQRRGHAISSDGRFLAVVVSEAWDEAERDEMPSYVTENGYVSTSGVRHKVGVREGPSERLFVIDTQAEQTHEVDLTGLDGIADDPLAFLKVQEAEDDEADQDELQARRVSIGSLRFRPGSSDLVVQVESRDNKDRWVVAVGPAKDDEVFAANQVFRESTEGWINWRTGRSGWLADGSAYWFLSEDDGYSHVYAWDGSSVRQVTNGEHEFWDVVRSPEPGVLLARTNLTDPAVYEVARISLADDSVRLVSSFGSNVERFSLSPTGERLLMEVSTNDRPVELFVQGVEGETEAAQLTDSLSDEFARLPWVVPEYVDVPCRDGRSIRARVYSVDGRGQREGVKPGVIFVHGAGYTQNVHKGWPYYFREMMFHSLLAYKGYVVLDIDFRASAGYGREFREAIYRDMGGPEIEDMVDTAAWMCDELGVDAGSIGTYGGSYGGFLAIMAVFKEPEVFNAAAALRPVTDWAHYNHGYTSNILNTPDVDPEAYERSSPIEHAEGFQGGLLICHGMLDDNVLVQDTIRLQQRLIELEKQDWEVALYPLEGHGFIEPSAWLDEYRRVLKLFEQRLNSGG